MTQSSNTTRHVKDIPILRDEFPGRYKRGNNFEMMSNIVTTEKLISYMSISKQQLSLPLPDIGSE